MARRILAVVLLAMAAGQLSDVAGFVDIVATYEVGGAVPAGIVAAVLVVGELVAGLGLLVAGRVRRPGVGAGAGTVAVAIAVVWSVLAAQAFARGLVLDNCGCFGVHLGQPLRWWVLVEDAELVALALWVRHQATDRRSLTDDDRPGAELGVAPHGGPLHAAQPAGLWPGGMWR